MADERNQDPQMDAAGLYREEMITDRKVGAIRQLTPVTADGAPDTTRPVMFVGQAEIMTNMGPVPLRASAVEQSLKGQPLSAESVAKAAEHAADGTNPPADLNASADYKRHLAQVLTRRALSEAAGLA